jgi:deoxyribonuclease-4
MKNKTKNPDVRIGVHTSIAGGVSRSIERAARLGCNTVQIFSHSPRQWRKAGIPLSEAKRFAELRLNNDISPVFVHASYLINLASLSSDVVEKSIDLLSYEMENADRIGAEYLVLHTGSATGQDRKTARKKASAALKKCLRMTESNTSIILENTAGQRGDITSTIQALADIMNSCGSDRVAGICIDTCHAFASGYDIRSGKGRDRLFHEIKKNVGIKMVKLVHLNDSKKPLGSGVDRHEHIGRGMIGLEGFRNILSDFRITNVPMVLETPKLKDDDDEKNLGNVYSLMGRWKR